MQVGVIYYHLTEVSHRYKTDLVAQTRLGQLKTELNLLRASPMLSAPARMLTHWA